MLWLLQNLEKFLLLLPPIQPASRMSIKMQMVTPSFVTDQLCIEMIIDQLLDNYPNAQVESKPEVTNNGTTKMTVVTFTK